jgi:ADP-ribosylglycohydrolase
MAEGRVAPEAAIGALGQGWVGEEALAIAVFCALRYQNDFAAALRAAVNHGGDSDSTGAIAGNILGAYGGDSAIPTEWLEAVELREVIEEMADDLLLGCSDTPKWREKYPGR